MGHGTFRLGRRGRRGSVQRGVAWFGSAGEKKLERKKNESNEVGDQQSDGVSRQQDERAEETKRAREREAAEAAAEKAAS